MTTLVWGILAEEPPGPPLIGNNIVFYSILGVVILMFMLTAIRWLRRRRPVIDPEAALIENLGEYPPAGPGSERVLLFEQPMRLRLVVLAPLGKQPLPGDGAVEPLLERLVYGLGEIARQDRPHVRVWPPQLSQQGFAPKFFRLTRRPEQTGKPSPWVLVAGPVRRGGQTFLLGLALCAEEPADRGNVSLQAEQWSFALRLAPKR